MSSGLGIRSLVFVGIACFLTKKSESLFLKEQQEQIALFVKKRVIRQKTRDESKSLLSLF